MRLRRNDDATTGQEAPSFATKPTPTMSPVAAATSTPVSYDEAPDLYSEDRELGHSIRELEDCLLYTSDAADD